MNNVSCNHVIPGTAYCVNQHLSEPTMVWTIHCVNKQFYEHSIVQRTICTKHTVCEQTLVKKTAVRAILYTNKQLCEQRIRRTTNCNSNTNKQLWEFTIVSRIDCTHKQIYQQLSNHTCVRTTHCAITQLHGPTIHQTNNCTKQRILRIRNCTNT